MKRKYALWALGLAVVTTASILLANALRPPREIYGLTPISADEAILLTRRDTQDRGRFWAQLVRTDGTVLWGTELTPNEALCRGGFTAIAASADRVVLLADRHVDYGVHRTVAIGLARTTGEKIWETVVDPNDRPQASSPTLIVDEPRVYALHDRVFDGVRRETTVSALALQDGAVLWTLRPRDADEAIGALSLLTPGTLLTSERYDKESVAVDGATGQVRRPLARSAVQCVTPSGSVWRHGSEVAFMPRSDAQGNVALTWSAISDHWGPAGPSNWGPSGPCGEREGDVIVGLVSYPDSGEGYVAGFARIDPIRGSARWTLALGSVFFELMEGLTSADGRLPRFLPVVVRSEKEAGTRSEVVIVDLDLGRIVARHPSAEDGNGFYAFVTAERAFVIDDASDTLFALDPKSGALASATRLQGLSLDGYEVHSQGFRFGALWLAGREGRPADLPWAVFDLATAKPLHLNGSVTAIDVTGEGWR